MKSKLQNIWGANSVFKIMLVEDGQEIPVNYEAIPLSLKC